MKSTMKSTFAIIAVALMVLVAVVPMVGVFTSDSDAAVVSDPSEAKDTFITVTVKLYDAAKSVKPTDADCTIQVAYNNKYVWNQAIETADAGTTFTLYESSIDKLTITYVDKEKKEIKDYSKVELTKLVAGKTYTADLIAGHVTGTASFYFAGGADAITKEMIGTNTVKASYKLYELVDEEYKEIKGEGDDFVLSYNGDGKLVGTYNYPNGTLTNKFIAITSFTGFTPATFSKTTYVALAATANFSAVETLIVVEPNNVVHFPLTVALEGKKGETPSALNFKTIKNTFAEKEDDFAYFSVDDTGTGPYSALKMTVSFNNKSDVVTEGLDDLDDFEDYDINNAFYGQVTMNGYVQDGTLTAKIAKSTAESTPYSVSVKTVDGYFFAFIGGNDIATGNAITDIQLDSKFDGINRNIVINGVTNIELAYDGIYSEVSGNMYLKTDAGTAIVGKELKVSGATTFGPLKTKAAGAFAFMSETGKNIIISIDGAALSGDVSVVAGGQSTGLKLVMGVQKYTVKVQDALGNSLGANVTVTFYDKEKDGTVIEQTAAGAVYDASTKTWSGEIRGDVTLTNDYVQITYAENAYNFTIVKYSDSVAIKAKEATYKFGFYSPTGELLEVIADNVEVYESTVFENSDGALIFDQVTVKATELGTDGLLSLKTESKYVTVKESDIGTSKTTVYAIYPKAAMSTMGIFKDVYLFSVNDKGKCVIVAAYDSYTATLTRINETTPIMGIKVELTLDGTFGEGHTVDTAYTQANGSFTLYSYAAIADDANTKIKFTAANGYTFEDSYAVYDNHVAKELYTAKTDAYMFVFTDADGALIDLTTAGATTTVNETVIPATATASFAWKAGKEVDVTMVKADKPYRTFETNYLTAEEAASGLVCIESEQSTFALFVEDAKGVGRNVAAPATDIVFYAEYEGVSYGPANVFNNDIPAMVATPVGPLFPGVYTFLVTNLFNEDLLDAKVTGFAVVATLATYGLTEDDAYVDIESDETLITAPYAKISYTFKDASGADLLVAPGAVTAYKNGILIDPFATETFNKSKIEFINDPEADYAFSFAASAAIGEGFTADNKYTFDPLQEPVDGVLYANEELVYGDVVDATGIEIAAAEGKTITAKGKTGYDDRTAVYVVDTYEAQGGMFYKMFVDTTMIKGYSINGFGAYTFALSSTPVIYANEQTILFSAMTANGCDIDGATFTAPKAYNENNVLIGSAFGTAGVIADVDEVSYFKVGAVNVVWDILGELNFNLESSTGIFTANESYLTGTVPFCGKAGTEQAVEFDFYLDGNLVSYEIFEIEGYEYEVLVDLSGMVVNGVAFDSIEATYYENGVVIASGVIDPTTPVNNIVSPIEEIYVAELLAPSALIANHVAIEQIGVTVTVTADSNFMIADDEGVYTDGQYTYTFAGWYVDNEKVSASPVFTFELTDDVVISPQYTVTYEKTSDANDKQTPQPQPVQSDNSIDTNVLIIGICAVIVALIAVVYAVIKKE